MQSPCWPGWRSLGLRPRALPWPTTSASLRSASPATPSAETNRLRQALRAIPPEAYAAVVVDARLDKLLDAELGQYVAAASQRRKFTIVRVAVEGLDDAAPAQLRKALTDVKRQRP